MHPFWPSAATGGFAGALGSMLSGAKDSKEVLRNALAQAAIAGAIGGGGYEAGKALVGEPDPRDPKGYTKRSALGGALGGSAIGAGLGALSHSIPSDIYLFNQLKKLPRSKAALAGALALGAFGGYQGAEEGVLQDAIQQERMRSAYGF